MRRSISRRRIAGLLALVALLLALWWWRREAQAPIAAPSPPVASRERGPTKLVRPQVSSEPKKAPAVATPHEVRCRVHSPASLDGPVDIGVLLSRDSDGAKIMRVSGHISGGLLTFAHRSGSGGTSWLDVPGFVTAPFHWSAESDGSMSCPPIILRAAAVVVGRVRPPPSNGNDVWVSGCGQWESVAEDGSFYLEVGTEPCTLTASRYDGVYEVNSAPVDVTPNLDGDTVLDLFLPESSQAGIGAAVEAAPDGFLLSWVAPDSAAEGAGLLAGDVVVAVDGVDARGLTIEEFRSLTIGDVGTDVVIEVVVDGTVEVLTLRRSPVAAPPH